MGKAGKAGKAQGPRSSPYDRPKSAPKSASAGLKFNTNFGQHILKNPGIADQIVLKSFIRETDRVLEVGPGTGNITVRALEKAKHVTAVELDPRMAAEITKRVQGTHLAKKLEVIVGDVIKLPELPPHDVFVSNTPYQISSPLVFKILGMKNPPRCAVLMFQREFAQRLIARPGEKLYGRLSVNVNMWSNTKHIMKVGKQNFKPPPKVESDVVRIEPKTGSARPNISFEEWDGMLRVAFNRPNKTLRAAWLEKTVLAMCERNYKVWCAMNNIPVDESIIEDAPADDDDNDEQMDLDPDSEWGGIADADADAELDADADAPMDEDDDTPAFFKELNAATKSASSAAAAQKTQPKRPRTKVAAVVREKVRKVLEDTTGLAEMRSRMLDQNDFLKLLIAFNEEGIHFS